MKKLTALIILLLAFAASDAQTRNVSATSFGYAEMYEYMEVLRGEIAEKIYADVEKGKLTAYKTRLLDKPFTAKEFSELGRIGDYVSMPNPENPDNIYDLIDTMIYTYIEPLLVNAIELDYPRVLVLKVDSVNRAFFSLAELKKQLYGDQNAWIDFFIAKKFIILDRQGLKPFAEKEFKQMALKWYDLGASGKVKAYEDKQLDSTYTLEEIKKRLALREEQSIPNPDNPNDKYDLIDTVVTTPFNPDTINRLLVYHSWNLYGKGGVSVNQLAYAPIFFPIVLGLQLGPVQTFLLKPTDVSPFFTPQENNFYGNFFTFLLRNMGTDEINRDSVYEW